MLVLRGGGGGHRGGRGDSPSGVDLGRSVLMDLPGGAQSGDEPELLRVKGSLESTGPRPETREKNTTDGVSPSLTSILP